ncbi:Eukaryotic/viral aspartic protease [Phytophthora megakarya]|uniref:Eukaryotic/viral aspartic protease n=1 Tax=Phytophthora megakarya TaxID=4795 RepID=A0A225WMG4_9STRA|nr:Eukaryotic/viral aspartic protease [Phytophthora megakarya]
MGAQFGDLMIGPARQWVKVHYADGSPEEKRGHVELFINTLGVQEQKLASRITLMEIPGAATLEKKLRARQGGLAPQKKSLFGSTKFRKTTPAKTPSPPRAVHRRIPYNACGDVHEVDKCTLEKFFNRLRQLFDPQKHAGADVSILNTTFAREVGCLIDTSITQVCVGIRDETYFKVDLAGQHAILGMDFMVPAGVRIDAAAGTACLPDEVRIQLIGRGLLYGTKMNIPSLTRIVTGDSYGIPPMPDKMTPMLCKTRGGPETPMTERREYQDPKSILRRTETEVKTRSERREPVVMTVTIKSGSTGGRKEMIETRDADVLKSERLENPATETPDDVEAQDLKLEDISEYEHTDAEGILHEDSEQFVEDLEAEMAVRPEISLTVNVKIEDLKVGLPTGVDQDEAVKMEEMLRKIVWKKRKWLIGKGNALPPRPRA